MSRSVEPPATRLRLMEMTTRRMALALLAALGVASCQSGGEPRPAALAPAAPATPSTPPSSSGEGGCNQASLTPADATRLRVYEAALRHVLRKGDQPAYLTSRPVPARGVSAAAQARQATFSPELLACLVAGPGGVPPLQAVTGFEDKRVVKTEANSLPRLTEGRLVQLSGLDEQALMSPAVVFVSLNGGGGFDYRDQTMRLEALRGGWAVTKDLGGAIA